MNQTHRDGVDEGSDSEWQAAAQHGEDGVAQVVLDRFGQRALGQVHRGLDGDGGGLRRVLLIHGIRLISASFTPIGWWTSVALQATNT